MPCGIVWHQNICAYDAILSVMHAMWASNKDKYTQIFNGTNNEILVNLSLNFMKHSSRIKALESTRDDMRCFLHQLAPHYFQWAHFTSIPLIAKYMLTFPADTMTYTYRCKNNHITPARTPNNTCLISAGQTIYASVSDWMTSMSEESLKSCIMCSKKLTLVKAFPFPLPFMALDLCHFHSLH